jgi:hypothetical protein
MGKRLTTEEFIRRSRKIHGDKFEYDKVNYIKYNEKVKIFCKGCSKYFLQTPNGHLSSGYRCYDCSGHRVKNQKLRITQNEVKRQLYYNPFSGVFRWRINRGNRFKKWDIAGSYHKHSGYCTIRLNGFLYKAHILAWIYMKGYYPPAKIDHIDHIRENNKWNNLRLVNDICHVRNSMLRSNNRYGVTGISRNKASGTWSANITVAYKSISLGTYKTKTEAVKARWEAENKYGFTNCNTTSSAYLYLKERGLING